VSAWWRRPIWRARQRSIVVLDDVFPNTFTGFRIAEYNYYLDNFPRLRVFSTNAGFEAAHRSYEQLYPQLAGRVLPYDDNSLDDCSFAYMNFLNNAHHFLPDLEARNMPFVFTLYPGGGFGLDDPESDARLERVVASPQLRGIIVTQPITADYLRRKARHVPTYEIIGVAVNPLYFSDTPVVKRRPPERGVARICFAAERYMDRGLDKGYPEFISAASILAREMPGVAFSIIGPWDPSEVPIDSDIAERFQFVSRLDTPALAAFFHRQDIIVSPNRPFVLGPGRFDGFPTGCCVEASLCGVTVVCSDILRLNRLYIDGEEIILCDPEPNAIAGHVRALVNDPARMAAIGQRGRNRTRMAYNPDRQLGRRLKVLKMSMRRSRW
jgi:lipopolysaccharide transport system ATP-binding protein